MLDGVAFYHEHGCDSIIGIGGGSPIDAAKAIRLKATHPLDLAEYDDNIGGDAKITSNIPPFIAIPTTAGTGSEVGRSTVITIAKTNRKTVIFSPHLIPSLAHRRSGADARHAAAHHRRHRNGRVHPQRGGVPVQRLPADLRCIALGGAKLASENLPRVMEQPDDLEARGNMMMASMMGAIAFQKGLGATHSLAHPLSSEFGMHHGTTNAVLLPAVLEYNAIPSRAAFRRPAQGIRQRPDRARSRAESHLRHRASPSRLRHPGRRPGHAGRESDRGRLPL